MGTYEKNPILQELSDELGKSLELTLAVPAAVYAAGTDAPGTVGAHIRHNLDFVKELLRGVRIGSIDYARRERDRGIETDRYLAAAEIEATIKSLRFFTNIDPATLVTVRSEARPEIRHRSSFSRELEFVYSHTVHHHALVNELLRRHGIVGETELGVAPSTKDYWNKLKTAA